MVGAVNAQLRCCCRSTVRHKEGHEEEHSHENEEKGQKEGGMGGLFRSVTLERGRVQTWC